MTLSHIEKNTFLCSERL